MATPMLFSNKKYVKTHCAAGRRRFDGAAAWHSAVLQFFTPPGKPKTAANKSLIGVFYTNALCEDDDGHAGMCWGSTPGNQQAGGVNIAVAGCEDTLYSRAGRCVNSSSSNSRASRADIGTTAGLIDWQMTVRGIVGYCSDWHVMIAMCASAEQTLTLYSTNVRLFVYLFVCRMFLPNAVWANTWFSQ